MRTQLILNGVNLPEKLTRRRQAELLSERSIVRTKRGKGILYESPRTVKEFDLEFDNLTGSELNTLINAAVTGMVQPVSFVSFDNNTYTVIVESFDFDWKMYTSVGSLYSARLRLRGS